MASPSDLSLLRDVSLNVLDDPTIIAWQAFFDDNEAPFAEEEGALADGEHSLKATEIHAQFVAMVEGQLETYLGQIGMSTEVRRAGWVRIGGGGGGGGGGFHRQPRLTSPPEPSPPPSLSSNSSPQSEHQASRTRSKPSSPSPSARWSTKSSPTLCAPGVCSPHLPGVPPHSQVTLCAPP